MKKSIIDSRRAEAKSNLQDAAGDGLVVDGMPVCDIIALGMRHLSTRRGVRQAIRDSGFKVGLDGGRRQIMEIMS